MPAAFVQSLTGTSLSANPGSGTWGSALTVGNVIVLTIVNDSGTSNYITSVTSANATWTRVSSQVDGQGSDTEIWWGLVTASTTAAFTIGYSLAGSTRIVWCAQEFSGLDTAAPFDKVSTVASGTSTTPLSGSTGTLAQADSLIVGHVAWVTGTSTLAAGSGYSGAITNGAAATSARFGGQEYKTVAATTAQTADFVLGTSRPWGCIASVWKAAAAGGPSTRPVVGGNSPAVVRASTW